MFDKWYGSDKSVFNGKINLLHQNFYFSKNALRNFNFILGYTIYTFTSIIHFLIFFKKEISTEFFILLIYVLNVNYFKTSFRAN